MSRKKTHEEYENELFEKEIDVYPLEKYVNNRVPILHTCSKGHEWKASPGNIKNGRRCPSCSGIKKKTLEEYLKELKHKQISYYPLQDYLNNSTPILHECLEGHVWKIKPQHILAGHGCPICSKTGFNPNKPAELYFVSFVVDDIKYYKIGITNRTAKERLAGDWSKFNFEIEWFLQSQDGNYIQKLELEIKRLNQPYQINTKALKSGNTETFTVYIDKPREIK